MQFALLLSVRTTDLFCWRWWLESKIKYWSVGGVFRYTVKSKEQPLSLRVVHESRNGSLPSIILIFSLFSFKAIV